MRAIIQRVTEASVMIDGKIHDSIHLGIVLLLGIEDGDTDEDIEWLSGKIARLRIFNDAENVMNLSITDVGGDVLLISQFTLHASTKKGNRPSYIKASHPDIAIPLYDKFKNKLRFEMGKAVHSGIFGANMKVSLINYGPVTIYIDTKNKE